MITPEAAMLSGANMRAYDLTYTTEVQPIHCIDCGTIIAQYEHIKEDGMEWWGYRDTIARIDSADSLRCGKCYRRHARLE